MENISAKALYALQQKGDNVYILDVRTPKEFAAVHIVGATLQPIDEFDPELFISKLKDEGQKNPKIYVTCATGVRATRACHMLEKAGYENVILIEGGTVAWDEAGYPVERSLSIMPLQQQVKIFQAAVIILGALLGSLSSVFLLLPIFIGAEMIYSVKMGSSLWSGLFAKMPWNL